MKVGFVNLNCLKALGYSENIFEANKYLPPSEKIKGFYYKGNFSSDIFKKCVAVVGSRNSSGGGEKNCKSLIRKAVDSNLTVVSGLARGIDSVSHKETLNLGGKTIAVLGQGIENKIQQNKKDLYNGILRKGGLIISEYRNQNPKKWTYPRRNRLIAGLSELLIVVEASKNSGSEIVAKYALRMGRKVYVTEKSKSLINSVGKGYKIGNDIMLLKFEDTFPEIFESRGL